MSNVVFYDFETTGLDPKFDQIIQVGAILVDEKLNEQDRLELRCRLNPGVIPNPRALLVNKTPISSLLEEKLSHYQMIEKLRNKFLEWSRDTAIFVGWNTIDFDENMLRQALFKNLREPYLTNTNGNQRLDAMVIARAVAAFSPNSIEVPRNDKGKLAFKLELMAPANGIKDFDAHTAIGDVEATIEMAKLCKKRASSVWERARISMVPNQIQSLFEEEKFYCTVFPWWPGEIFALTYIGANIQNKKEVALFDLRYDPEEFLESSLSDINQLLDEKPKKNAKIKVMKTNNSPIFMEEKYADGQKEYANIGINVLEERADKIRRNENFQQKVSQALTDRDGQRQKDYPKDFPEQRIYESFTSNRDRQITDRFHDAEWGEKLALSSDIQDEKLACYGKRMIFYESPDLLSDKVRREVEKDVWRYAIETHWLSNCREELYAISNKADDDGDQDTKKKLKALTLLYEYIDEKCKSLS